MKFPSSSILLGSFGVHPSDALLHCDAADDSGQVPRQKNWKRDLNIPPLHWESDDALSCERAKWHERLLPENDNAEYGDFWLHSNEK